MKQTYEHDAKIDNFYDNINKNIADSHNYLCDKYNNDIRLMFLDTVCTFVVLAKRTTMKPKDLLKFIEDTWNGIDVTYNDEEN